MKADTHGWIRKAEGDYATARREINPPGIPNYDAVCFHAQQCAEKYLKARLTEAGQFFPKTHDLEALLNWVLPIEPDWEDLRDSLLGLTSIGIEVRYPGTEADQEDARQALESASRVRHVVRSTLHLDPG
jgi:HEPN domain-containing protein